MGPHRSAARLATACTASLAAAAFAPQPVLAQARPATPALGPAELSVDCPVLSGEWRSSLEARARAELAMKRLAQGRLQIQCAAARVSVEFIHAPSPSQHRNASLTGEPKAIVEQILALVHEVTTISAAPSAETTAQNLPQAPANASAAPDVNAEPQLSPTPETPPPPAHPPGRARVEPALRSPRPTPALRSAPLQLEPGIGVFAEVWAAAPLVLLGPSFSFGFRPGPAWRIAPTLAVAWGTSRPNDIAVRNLTAGIEASFGKRLWLGAGARVAYLHFAPSAALSPSSENAVEPEFTLRAGYSFVGRRQSLAATLGLRAYSEYREIRVDGSTAFRVPVVAITAGAEYRFELSSSSIPAD